MSWITALTEAQQDILRIIRERNDLRAEVERLRADNQTWAVRWQEQYDRAERLAHQAGDRP